MNTRIKLIETNEGYLDVKEGVKVPITFSISDIRDLSSRSGSFSKTIKLAGSKNNSKLLNSYFNVNISDGSFNVNKVQKCQIIRDDEVILDNCYMRLKKVIKSQNTSSMVDEIVEYEIQVQDEMGNFFKSVSNKKLNDLETLGAKSHKFTISNIVNSFDNTEADGYKYVLPFSASSGSVTRFYTRELAPGIYLKTIFDAIHNENGYAYQWDSLQDDLFDKLIQPYSGDMKKLTNAYIEQQRVTVNKTGSVGLSSFFWYNNFPSTLINLSGATVKDEMGYWNGSTSKYNNQFQMYNPDKLVYNISFDYQFNLENHTGKNLRLKNTVTSGMLEGYHDFFPFIEIKKQDGTIMNVPNRYLRGMTSNHSTVEIREDDWSIRIKDYNTTLTDYSTTVNQTLVSGTINMEIPISYIYTGDVLQVNFSMNTFRKDCEWIRIDTGEPSGLIQFRSIISNVVMDIKPSVDSGMVIGSDVTLQEFLPNDIQQSDFLKSVYQKFNLYAVIDDDNPNLIKYETRDDFYDKGELKDWTLKLDKSKNQELIFLPEVTARREILSYKDDSNDKVLEAYKTQTGKTFGQIAFQFQNENVKGDNRKELLWSPTVNIDCSFGANLPLLPEDFKHRPRVLLDGGKLPCQYYEINDQGQLFYPFLSMFDKPVNPLNSIEFAISDFYPYNVGQYTNNNLYNKYWSRTLTQIDEGKMLVAYFNLGINDIGNLKMNDKILVNGTVYIINKVIDYDVNTNDTTKVELLTLPDTHKYIAMGNDMLSFPGVGIVYPGGKNSGGIRNTGNGNGGEGTSTSSGVGSLGNAIATTINDRNKGNNIYSSPESMNSIVMGSNNVIGPIIPSVVIGDGIEIDKPGFYVKGSSMTEDGLEMFNGDIVIDNEGIHIGDLEITGEGDITVSGIPVERGYEFINVINTPTFISMIGSLEENKIYYIQDRRMYVYGHSSGGYRTRGYKIYNSLKSEYYWNQHNEKPMIKKGLSISNNGEYIWGGQLWKANNSGTLSDFPSDDSDPNINTNGITFTHIPSASEDIILAVDYGFVFDSIIGYDDFIPYTVYGPRGNIITTGYYNRYYEFICDWNDKKIYNNKTISIINNSNTGDIYNNSNGGQIYNNSNTGDIYNNSNTGDIYNNSNGGSIDNNSNTGYIDNNSNGGSIDNNSNGGFIRVNSNTGDIYNNSNTWYIRDNSNTGRIYNNSNTGQIENNSNGGSIYNNSNTGYIYNNSNGGSIDNNSNTGDIDNNSNTGVIELNNNSGAIENNKNIRRIYRNLNNGRIYDCDGTFGFTGGDIEQNVNNGSITVTLNYITGFTQASVKNNVNNGSISGIKTADVSDPIENK